jgi:DICT domain-containing protein
MIIRLSDLSQGKKGKTEAEVVAATSKESQFYRQLEQKYHCAEHDKACAVLAEGKHYHFTANDLSKWSYLIVCL